MSHIKLQNVTKAYDDNTPVISHLDLEIEQGSFTVLLGASGCGKSTILRMIAGLEHVTSGDIFIEDAPMTDVNPGERDIAMVFQNYALYPTMTVYKNIEFGLKNMKVPTEERKRRIAQVAETVGLSAFLDRKPQNLSGGQRQRVALARAIVKEPKVFLMDEPLSNLDAKLRTQIRTDLIELYRRLGTTFVYVTHDQIEAMSMGTKIILFKHGEIQQIGTPTEIYETPANIYTAKFIGSPPMNVLETSLLYCEKNPTPEYTRVAYLGFRPEKVRMMGDDFAEGDFSCTGEILARELLGDQIQYKLKLENGETVNIKTFNQKAMDYSTVSFYVKQADLCYFDSAERRIPTTEASEVFYVNN